MISTALAGGEGSRCEIHASVRRITRRKVSGTRPPDSVTPNWGQPGPPPARFLDQLPLAAPRRLIAGDLAKALRREICACAELPVQILPMMRELPCPALAPQAFLKCKSTQRSSDLISCLSSTSSTCGGDESISKNTVDIVRRQDVIRTPIAFERLHTM
jgi:hypothetical protein